MKILILSDSHDRDIDIDNTKYDYIIHAGDMGYSYDYLNNINAISVRGNCDFYGDNEKIIEILNKKIFITHGHLYNVKNDLLRLKYKALSLNIDYVIYGHTHIRNYILDNNIIYINPGAYQDGYYVIIDDDSINYYRYNDLIKKIKKDW